MKKRLFFIIIRHLKECEVMEVFSDHIDAFYLKFHSMSRFKSKAAIYPDEDESERMNKRIFKVLILMMDKIRFH